jgi:hypothetical protein
VFQIFLSGQAQHAFLDPANARRKLRALVCLARSLNQHTFGVLPGAIDREPQHIDRLGNRIGPVARNAEEPMDMAG